MRAVSPFRLAVTILLSSAALPAMAQVAPGGAVAPVEAEGGEAHWYLHGLFG